MNLYLWEVRKGLKPNSIRDVITNVVDDAFSFKFTPSSLKKTYLNACKKHISDTNLLEAFTSEITEDNPFYSKSSIEMRQYYEELLPLLTSRLFDATIKNDGVDEENVEDIVSKYHKKFHDSYVDKYGKFGSYKIHSFAIEAAKKDYDNGEFSSNIPYLNNLFKQCEIGYIFINSEYNQGLIDAPDKVISRKFFNSDYDGRLDSVIEIFKELGILEVFKPSEDTLRDELTYYATHNNMNFYDLTYEELLDIFNNVLLRMCEEKYKTKF